jgi:hypothetical protein
MMSFDPTIEPPIPCCQVPDRVAWLPARRGGKKPVAQTVLKWCQHGLRGHKLESLRIGSTLCTSERALVRFFQRLADENCSPGSPTAADSERNHRAAERELDRVGI